MLLEGTTLMYSKPASGIKIKWVLQDGNNTACLKSHTSMVECLITLVDINHTGRFSWKLIFNI